MGLRERPSTRRLPSAPIKTPPNSDATRGRLTLSEHIAKETISAERIRPTKDLSPSPRIFSFRVLV